MGNAGGLIGLWSIAFSPNYTTDNTFFVFYTDKTGKTTLARYFASTVNRDSAIANSGVSLITFPKSSGTGHYGDLGFGPDGYLYLTLGAGGNNKNSQDGQSLFGKMLRLNINVLNPPYYSIPADNPFVNDTTVLDQVWSLGLRNAWRWSFDRLTGDLWIPDVGQDAIEEVNFRTPAQSAGSNFGWQCYEGNQPFKLNGCGNISNYTFPIFQYPHNVSTGGECLIGGYIYRGSAYPQLQGYYICSDFLSFNAWKIKSNGTGGWNVYLQSNGIPHGIVSYGEDENAELYAVSQTTNTIYSIQATGALVASGNSDAIKATTNTKTFIYPGPVDNSILTLQLAEPYKSVRLLSMTGTEMMHRSLGNQTGKVTIMLPKLSAGMYVVQLIGNQQTLQQKIYISR